MVLPDVSPGRPQGGREAVIGCCLDPEGSLDAPDQVSGHQETDGVDPDRRLPADQSRNQPSRGAAHRGHSAPGRLDEERRVSQVLWRHDGGDRRRRSGADQGRQCRQDGQSGEGQGHAGTCPEDCRVIDQQHAGGRNGSGQVRPDHDPAAIESVGHDSPQRGGEKRRKRVGGEDRCGEYRRPAQFVDQAEHRDEEKPVATEGDEPGNVKPS